MTGKNLTTFYVDDAAVAIRELETPNANWEDGVNRGGSNACGIGINTGNYDPKESDWPRPETPAFQTSQIIGGTPSDLSMKSDYGGGLAGDVVRTAFVQASAPVLPDGVIAEVSGVDILNKTGQTIPADAWAWGPSDE